MKLAVQTSEPAQSKFMGKMCSFEFTVPIHQPDLDYQTCLHIIGYLIMETRGVSDHSTSGAEN